MLERIRHEVIPDEMRPALVDDEFIGQFYVCPVCEQGKMYEYGVVYKGVVQDNEGQAQFQLFWFCSLYCWLDCVKEAHEV